MSAGHLSAVQHNGHLVTHFYIGRSGNNLNGLRPYIHLAYNKLVCIRMLLNSGNLTDDNTVQILIQLFEAFYLCTGESHGIRILLGACLQIRHIHFYP